MSDNKKGGWLRQLANALLITVVVLIVAAAIGFGLLVGFCALGGRS